MNRRSQGIKLSTVAMVVLIMAVSAMWNSSSANMEVRQVTVNQEEEK